MQSSGSVIGWLAGMAAILWAVPIASGSPTQGAAMMDIPSLFATAQKEGRVGEARKSKLIDARPATPGEVVVTTIAGEGQDILVFDAPGAVLSGVAVQSGARDQRR